MSWWWGTTVLGRGRYWDTVDGPVNGEIETRVGITGTSRWHS